MIITEQEAIQRLSERVYENTKSIKQNDRQRRDRVLDLYGIEYYRSGDANSPARFYISVSPDLVYHERFEFKLIISPLISTSGSGVGPATVSVNDTSLAISGGAINPNPHKHTTNPHSHTIDAGIVVVPVTATDFDISVEGIDITDYLMAQYDWVSGEGVWPSTEIERNYDLLEVASDMVAEGRASDADKLLRPGFKPIEISANGPFACTMILYCKYSHANR